MKPTQTTYKYVLTCTDLCGGCEPFCDGLCSCGVVMKVCACGAGPLNDSEDRCDSCSQTPTG